MNTRTSPHKLRRLRQLGVALIGVILVIVAIIVVVEIAGVVTLIVMTIRNWFNEKFPPPPKAPPGKAAEAPDNPATIQMEYVRSAIELAYPSNRHWFYPMTAAYETNYVSSYGLTPTNNPLQFDVVSKTNLGDPTWQKESELLLELDLGNLGTNNIDGVIATVIRARVDEFQRTNTVKPEIRFFDLKPRFPTNTPPGFSL